MHLHALVTNVHVWKCPALARLDTFMSLCKITLHTMSWSRFELLPDDTDHFTWSGFLSFAEELVQIILTLPGNTLVLSDSTIDYWNYDDLGNQTNAASQYIESLCPSVHVDAVCGSGFTALRKDMMDFRTRLRTHNVRYQSVLFVGGWNDIDSPMEVTRSAIQMLTRPWRQISSR